jgi:hypothetical protein
MIQDNFDKAIAPKARPRLARKDALLRGREVKLTELSPVDQGRVQTTLKARKIQPNRVKFFVANPGEIDLIRTETDPGGVGRDLVFGRPLLALIGFTGFVILCFLITL